MVWEICLPIYWSGQDFFIDFETVKIFFTYIGAGKILSIILRQTLPECQKTNDFRNSKSIWQTSDAVESMSKRRIWFYSVGVGDFVKTSALHHLTAKTYNVLGFLYFIPLLDMPDLHPLRSYLSSITHYWSHLPSIISTTDHFWRRSHSLSITSTVDHICCCTSAVGHIHCRSHSLSITSTVHHICRPLSQMSITSAVDHIRRR